MAYLDHGNSKTVNFGISCVTKSDMRGNFRAGSAAFDLAIGRMISLFMQSS